MNETLKKTLFILAFIIILSLIIIKNNNKSKKLEKNVKYTVVKVLDAQVHGKNDTKNIIGKNVLLEYDSTDVRNNKVLIDYYVPDSIKIPINGWKYKPNWDK